MLTKDFKEELKEILIFKLLNLKEKRAIIEKQGVLASPGKVGTPVLWLNEWHLIRRHEITHETTPFHL